MTVTLNFPLAKLGLMPKAPATKGPRARARARAGAASRPERVARAPLEGQGRENARAVLTGADIGSERTVRLSVRAAEVFAAMTERERSRQVTARIVARARADRQAFEASLRPTTDRADRAHAVFGRDGRLYPAREVPNATPRRYHPSQLVTVYERGRAAGEVSVDSAADWLHEIRRRLHAETGGVEGITAGVDTGLGLSARMTDRAIRRFGMQPVRGMKLMQQTHHDQEQR